MAKGKKKEESLYPVEYFGCIFTESNTDEKFKAFYHSRDSLRGDGGIYAYDGMIIYPDGSIEDESEY